MHHPLLQYQKILSATVLAMCDAFTLALYFAATVVRHSFSSLSMWWLCCCCWSLLALCPHLTMWYIRSDISIHSVLRYTIGMVHSSSSSITTNIPKSYRHSYVSSRPCHRRENQFRRVFHSVRLFFNVWSQFFLKT